MSGDSTNAFSEGTLTFPSFDFTTKIFIYWIHMISDVSYILLLKSKDGNVKVPSEKAFVESPDTFYSVVGDRF